MNNLSESQLLMIAAQAKELVIAAQRVYRTPQLAMQSFESTGTHLIEAGAPMVGAVFLAAGRIIRMMLATSHSPAQAREREYEHS